MLEEETRYADAAVSDWGSRIAPPVADADGITLETQTRPRATPQGHALSREIRNGLVAATYDLHYRQDTTVEMEVEPSVLFGVSTGNETSLLNVDTAHDIEIKPHCPILVATGRHTSCKGRHKAGSRHISVGICVKKTFLEDLTQEHGCSSFAGLLDLLRGDVSFHYPPQSGRLFATVTSMLQAPYEGGLLVLHIESCALGLLTELARIVSEKKSDAGCRGLTRREFERAHQVRCILENNTANPPSLAELSRLVGVNPTTMSQQFKAVFGSTVFSYIRGRRLELAHQMLRSQSIPVSQVGYHVGFSNPGAFATAYRRHFGRPPSAEPRDAH